MLFNPYYLLFLPANSGVDNHTWASAFSQQEINGGNQPSSRGGKSPGAPVIELHQIRNPRKVPFIVGVWEFADWPRDPAGAGLKPPITDQSR